MTDEARDNNWSKVNELPKLKPKYPNPYGPPFHLWKPEVLAAYQTFPLRSGSTAPINDDTWPLWRKWAKDYQDRKELWPAKLHEYIDERKRQELKKARQGQ